MSHPVVAMETRLLAVTVFLAKNEIITIRNCLNPTLLTGLTGSGQY